LILKETRHIYDIHDGATNVSGESDVVEIILGSFDLARVLLCVVSKLEDGTLKELCIIIEVNLGVATNTRPSGVSAIGLTLHKCEYCVAEGEW
jgi:hypothetical protein